MVKDISILQKEISKIQEIQKNRKYTPRVLNIKVGGEDIC